MIENATMRDVERALGRLRNEASEGMSGPSLRTSVLTHMAWVPPSWLDTATRTLGGLEERHPSRTILLVPESEEDRDALDVDVDLRCFATRGPGGAVCFEVIEIHLCGARAHAPASVVSPLLISDLPVFLRWRGDLPFDEPELEQLVGVADRLIVDAREWSDADAGLERLPSVFDRVAVSDIAWDRTEPWREAIAQRWPEIADVRELRVVGPRAEALLLAGWLRSRLAREIELEHEPGEEIAEVEADGEEIQVVRRGSRSPSDLLSDQLDVFCRHSVYEEAVRGFSSVPA